MTIASGTAGTCTWTIDDSGNLSFGSGNLTWTTTYPPWYDYREQITSAWIPATVNGNGTAWRRFFSDCTNLKTVNIMQGALNNVIDMGWFFYNCTSLEHVHTFMQTQLTNPDTIVIGPKVYSGYQMFYRCSSLETIQIDGMRYLGQAREDGTHATNGMYRMFYDCTSLRNIQFLDTVDIGTHIVSLESLFCNCESLESVNLDKFNTSNVTDMRWLFYGCMALKQINLSSFNTSKVTLMKSMFCYCNSLEKLDLSSFDTNNVTDMSFMFQDCFSLEKLNIANFTFTNIATISYMLYRCENLKYLYLGEFSWIPQELEAAYSDTKFPNDLYNYNGDKLNFQAGVPVDPGLYLQKKKETTKLYDSGKIESAEFVEWIDPIKTNHKVTAFLDIGSMIAKEFVEGDVLQFKSDNDVHCNELIEIGIEKSLDGLSGHTHGDLGEYTHEALASYTHAQLGEGGGSSSTALSSLTYNKLAELTYAKLKDYIYSK